MEAGLGWKAPRPLVGLDFQFPFPHLAGEFQASLSGKPDRSLPKKSPAVSRTVRAQCLLPRLSTLPRSQTLRWRAGWGVSAASPAPRSYSGTSSTRNCPGAG